METQTDVLVRKQFFLSPENISKLERLTKTKGLSAAKIVRDAIDAYNPDRLENMEQEELIAIAREKVQEAIVKTEAAIEKVDHCLENLSKRRAG